MLCSKSTIAFVTGYYIFFVFGNFEKANKKNFRGQNPQKVKLSIFTAFFAKKRKSDEKEETRTKN